MRNAIIGIVIGIVIGVVSGATVVAPRLNKVDKINPIIGLAAQKSSRFEKLDKIILPSAKDQKNTDSVEKASTSKFIDVGEIKSNKPSNANTKNSKLILGSETIHWKMASAYPSSLPQLGTLATKLDRDIWRVSDGMLEVKFHEPGALVPPLKMFDAVRAGVIDAAFSSPGFWGNKIPALQLFSAIPFGPPAEEFLAWIYYGGGQKLFNEIYNANGIHSIFCGLIAPEASGWFRKRIRTVEDLKGLRMRFFGLGAKVVEKLGVITTQLTSGDIFMAFEAGKIDAAEFSIPSTDLKLGLHKMIKNYYFPGWHQPATLFELMINIEQWRALPASAKAQLKAVCGDNIRQGLAESGGTQLKALKKLQSEGVIIRRWPREVLYALKSAWIQVAREEAKSDPNFNRVWQSLRDFRKDYAIWHELNLQ
jgi:TRAP-type mannitol/chloroaromatic compound transport system substrate-binding protein